jgi:hypothetical protein
LLRARTKVPAPPAAIVGSAQRDGVRFGMWGKALLGIVGSIALVGCGGENKSVTNTTAASSSRASTPAWKPGTPMPKLTDAQIAQAGYGLTKANANLGTVDEVLGSVPADVRVDPSAKTLNDQYARFGRCIGEQTGIHDLGHELALLIAYNRKDRAALQAVEKESATCEGFQIANDPSYKRSLKTNP